jgi:flagellar motility protein MotE (MotC chaperone)
MKQKSKRKFRTLSVTLLLLLGVLLLKLSLTVGNFATPKKDGGLSLFASEVMAEDAKGDTKGKAKKPAASGKDKGTPEASQTGNASESNNRPSSTSVPEMISHLQRRDAELTKKEEQLKQKEEYLAQMEQEVEKKLKDLMAVQKEIQTFRAEREEGQLAKVRSLSKIYGTMKPKEAAKLLENLEENLVVEVISTMSAAEAANILSNMDVKKAAKISQALSTH